MATKPQTKIRVLNKEHCAFYDTQFYTPFLPNESGFGAYSVYDGMENDELWSSTNATIRTDKGVMKITSTAVNGTATYEFGSNRLWNGGFEKRFEGWSISAGMNVEPSIVTSPVQAGSRACQLTDTYGGKIVNGAPNGISWYFNEPFIPDDVSIYYNSNGTGTATKWSILVTFYYEDGTHYSSEQDPVASYTELDETDLAAIIKSKKLTRIRLKAYDGSGGLYPYKTQHLQVDSISISATTAVDPTDAPYFAFKTKECDMTSGNLQVDVRRDGISTWDTVATLTSISDNTEYRYNLRDVVGTTYDYDQIRFLLTASGDMVEIDYFTWGGVLDWQCYASETGGWQRSDNTTLEIDIETNGDINALETRDYTTTGALNILTSETPYVSIRFKAGTDIDVEVDAYVDSAWTTDIFSDDRTTHTDDWELHTVDTTALGTEIDGLRIKCTAQEATADAQIDFIAIHTNSDDCYEYVGDYIEQVQVDKRSRRAESFTATLANPNGIFDDKLRSGTEISIYMRYDDEIWQKVAEGVIESKTQQLSASNEQITLQCESRGSFVRFNRLQYVTYTNVDYSDIILDIINNVCLDENGRRRIYPALDFCHKTYQQGNFYYPETTALDIFEEIADLSGYELYIDSESKIHFFYTEDTPYRRPEEYTEDDDIWTAIGTTTVSRDSTNVVLGDYSIKATYVSGTNSMQALGKGELVGILNQFTCFLRSGTADTTLTFTFYDETDTSIGTVDVEIVSADTWEEKFVVFSTSDSSVLLKKFTVASDKADDFWVDGLFFGTTMPKERRFPFPYDGDRFTEETTFWESGNANTVISLSDNSKVGSYSIWARDAGTDKASPRAKLGYWRVHSDVYNYLSFWWRASVYNGDATHLNIFLYSNNSLTDYYYQTIDITDLDLSEWNYFEIQLGTGSWSSSGSPSWNFISGFELEGATSGGTPQADWEDLWVDGFRFFYDGTPTEQISLDNENIIDIKVSRDIKQVVNRVKVEYAAGLDITVDDTVSQSIYGLREKTFRKPLYEEAQASAYAYSVILSQAFPRHSIEVEMIGNTDYDIGEFVSFNIPRLETFERGVVTGIKHKFSPKKGWVTEIKVGSPQFERVLRGVFDDVEEIKQHLLTSDVSEVSPPLDQVLSAGNETLGLDIDMGTGNVIFLGDTGIAIWAEGNDLKFDDLSNTEKTLSQLVSGTSDFPAVTDKEWWTQAAADFYGGAGVNLRGTIRGETASSEWKFLIGGGCNLVITDDGGTTDILTIDENSPFLITTAGDIQIGGDDIRDSGGNVGISFDGSGYIDYLGQQGTPSDNDVLAWDSGNSRWEVQAQAGGGIGGTGTVGTIAKFVTDSTTIGDSILLESGSNIEIDATAASFSINTGSTNDPVITFKNQDTDYMRLVGDITPQALSVQFNGGGWTEVLNLDANGNLQIDGDLTISGNDIKDSGTNTQITFTAGSLATFAYDIKISGDDIQDSSGATVLSFDGAGEVDKIGSHSGISTNDALVWGGTTWGYAAVLTSPMTSDLSFHSGADTIWYSDAGVSEVARVDGATGNITTSGTIDTVDLATFKSSYDSHDHSSGDPAQLDWDTCWADAAHDHSTDGEGGAIPEASITFSATGHSHDGTGSENVDYGDLDNVPSTFAPSAHDLTGSAHTESGLTIGTVLVATDTSGFAFGTMDWDNVWTDAVHDHTSDGEGGVLSGYISSPVTSDLPFHSGADLIIYSDAGSTEVARIDGATGNITTSGTVDTVDVASFKSTYDAHDHSSGDPTQVTYSDLLSIPSTFTPIAHDLVSAYHTASGLTPGEVLRASDTTSFAFGKLDWDVVWDDAVHTHSADSEGGTLLWTNIFSVVSAGDHTHASTTTGGTLTWANALAVATAGDHDHSDNTKGSAIPEASITFSTTGHHHTGVDSENVDYGDLDNIPSSFTPAAHTLATTGVHTGTLPLTDLAVGSQGSIIRRGDADWEEYALGTENYVLKAGATEPAWGQVAFSELTSPSHTHAEAAQGGTLTWANALSVASAGDHDHSDNTKGSAVPEASITFSTTGHHHTGVDSENVDYGDLDNVPSSFTPAAHVLVSASHTASGLNAGEVLRASDASSFAFGKLDWDVVWDDAVHSHASDGEGGTLTWANALAAAAAGDHDHSDNTKGNAIPEASITFSATGHSHDGSGSENVDYTNLDNVPSTFTPIAHELVSAYHTETGLTIGHFLKADSSTTFSFQAHGLTASDVGAIGNPTTVNVAWHSGADIIIYSDAGSTEVGRWDGATGNITTSGTVDAVDIAGHVHAGGIGDAGNVPEGNVTFSGSGHAHTGTTGGAKLDWDTCWADAVHNHTSDAEGGTLSSSSIFPVTSDTAWHSGADIIIYSDAGSTEVGRWDGATGDISSAGSLTLGGLMEIEEEATGVLSVHPATGDISGTFIVRPSGTSTTAASNLYNDSDYSNSGIYRTTITGTTVSLDSLAVGTGTAPTTLNINDSDWAAINVGDSACAVQIGGGVIATNTSGEVTALSDDTPSSNDLLRWTGAKTEWYSIGTGTTGQLTKWTGTMTFGNATFSDEELLDITSYGSANHTYYRVVALPHDTFPLFYNLNQTRFVGAHTPGYIRWWLTIPTTKGGYKLYIDGIQVGVHTADSSNLITLVEIQGLQYNSDTELYDSGALTLNSAQEWTDTFTAVDCSTYDHIVVEITCTVPTAANLKISYCALRCYYG